MKKSCETLPPKPHVTERVASDIEQCLQFVASHPWGRPSDRAAEIDEAIDRISDMPQLYPIKAERPSIGLRLRRANVAQFAIIYAYFVPTEEWPNGRVSIRAVRHASVQDVFLSVRDSASSAPFEPLVLN